MRGVYRLIFKITKSKSILSDAEDGFAISHNPVFEPTYIGRFPV